MMQSAGLYRHLRRHARLLAKYKAKIQKKETQFSEDLSELRQKIGGGDSLGDRFHDFAILCSGFLITEIEPVCAALKAIERSLKGKKGQLILAKHISGGDIGGTEYWRFGVITSERLLLTPASFRIEADPIQSEPWLLSPGRWGDGLETALYDPRDWLDYLRLRAELVTEADLRKKWSSVYCPPTIIIGNEAADSLFASTLEGTDPRKDGGRAKAWLSKFERAGFDPAKLLTFEALLRKRL